jgi:alpha-aminoadipic semialdehyde synthase
MGLDPGLDHLSAVSLIEKLKNGNRNLVSFISMCGGLPAPDDALDVPLKYKFSWRPEGVLIAALQAAHYLLLGDVGVI